MMFLCFHKDLIMSELYELPDEWEWKNIDRLRKSISQKEKMQSLVSLKASILDQVFKGKLS